MIWKLGWHTPSYPCELTACIKSFCSPVYDFRGWDMSYSLMFLSGAWQWQFDNFLDAEWKGQYLTLLLLPFIKPTFSIYDYNKITTIKCLQGARMATVRQCGERRKISASKRWMLLNVKIRRQLKLKIWRSLKSALWNTQDSRQFALTTRCYKLHGNTSSSIVPGHMRDQIIKKAGTLPTGTW